MAKSQQRVFFVRDKSGRYGTRRGTVEFRLITGRKLPWRFLITFAAIYLAYGERARCPRKHAFAINFLIAFYAFRAQREWRVSTAFSHFLLSFCASIAFAGRAESLLRSLRYDTLRDREPAQDGGSFEVRFVLEFRLFSSYGTKKSKSAIPAAANPFAGHRNTAACPRVRERPYGKTVTYGYRPATWFRRRRRTTRNVVDAEAGKEATANAIANRRRDQRLRSTEVPSRTRWRKSYALGKTPSDVSDGTREPRNVRLGRVGRDENEENRYLFYFNG